MVVKSLFKMNHTNSIQEEEGPQLEEMYIKEVQIIEVKVSEYVAVRILHPNNQPNKNFMMKKINHLQMIIVHSLKRIIFNQKRWIQGLKRRTKPVKSFKTGVVATTLMALSIMIITVVLRKQNVPMTILI